MPDLLLDEERIEAVLDQVRHVGVAQAVRPEVPWQAEFACYDWWTSMSAGCSSYSMPNVDNCYARSCS